MADQEGTAMPETIESSWSLWTRRAVAALFALAGVVLLAGGALLLKEGGSPYYLVVGLALLASSYLLWLRQALGLWLYGAVLAGSLAWSLWEVGFEPWRLVPRLGLPILMGCALLLPPFRRFARSRLHARPRQGWMVFSVSLVTALVVGGVLHANGPADPESPALRQGIQAQFPETLGQPLTKATESEWPAFGNDQGGSRFSPLTQLTTSNVDKLEMVWEADTGPMGPGPKNGLEVVPIMIGSSLYVCNGYNRVLSLDAETGRERWHYDMSNGTPASGKPCRGVTYYRVPGATGFCAERIFAASQTPTLVAVDAPTGKPCSGFGEDGAVDLRANISKYPQGQYYVSSAPQIVRGKVVVGGGLPDGQFWGGPSGVIRAYDAVTGKLAWAFDAGHPDRVGAPPPGVNYTPSSPNSWAPISADEALGLIYLPMGNSTPDNWGGQRRPFDDDLSSSVIALDADTGRLRWRFQTTHHDIWDYDVPAQPTLIDLPTADGIRPALIQATKRGEIFVLDRTNGQPIFPVAEVAAPGGGIAPGERLTSTQPSSAGMPAFRGPLLREKDMWGVTPFDQMMCRIQFRQSRYEGHLTPITLGKPVLVDPGSAGGVNWGQRLDRCRPRSDDRELDASP